MTNFVTLSDAFDLYNQRDLKDRLTNGLQATGRPVVFLVGSALTAPTGPTEPGVLDVTGIIDLIEKEFAPEQRREFIESLDAAENKYQEAFKILLRRRGQQVANNIIRKAVSSARSHFSEPYSDYKISSLTSDEACRAFDADSSGWVLRPGVEALGKLATYHRDRFGKTILTTNFDPLIEVSVKNAGGVCFRTFLHQDGNFGQTEGDGSHIVHLHGYWYGSDTLHTPRQLNQPRPQLKSSLSHLLRGQTVVVLAYGGWDDAFTSTLMDVALDNHAYPEVLWCHYDSNPVVRRNLVDLLRPGINRGRVTLYSGIDCHVFLPELLADWSEREPQSRTNPLVGPAQLVTSVQAGRIEPPVIPLPATPQNFPANEDRPPQIEHYVGRQEDLLDLQKSSACAVFITGIGGQGKSSLAASFFDSAESALTFSQRLWRDCKEQSETFDGHVIRVIQRLGGFRIPATDLAKQPMSSLAELLAKLTSVNPVLLIFDNIDHYVDLESGVLTGSAGVFLEEFLKIDNKSKIIFTCRPSIQYHVDGILSKRLGGLGLTAAIDLFRLRKAGASVQSIERAHQITGGHALWLDLLAAQVATRLPRVSLDDLLDPTQAGGRDIPDVMLRSIWQNLQSREQVVLQSLAETLRPTTALQLSTYVRSRLNYNRMSKAVRNLRNLNLLVVKTLDMGDEAYELHPVIRAFVREAFDIDTRKSFIDEILVDYRAFFGSHFRIFLVSPNEDSVSRWIDGAELLISANYYEEAFEKLDNVRQVIRRHGAPNEFVRVTSLLLSKINSSDFVKHKFFDIVFTEFNKQLVNLGRLSDATQSLERYYESITGKDSRYINYCEMQANMHWRYKNYPAAIKWAREGADLKLSSGVDTNYTPEHVLALAQRDSGAIDPAIEYFLRGAKIEDLMNPKNIEKERSGSYYGNVGRCLQLMGQIDPALICYRKSAYIIEGSGVHRHGENQAYIRQWIGELFFEKGQKNLGLNFLVAAAQKWAEISPPTSRFVESYAMSRCDVEKQGWPAPASAEEFVKGWIEELKFSEF